jgi:hypothetical protein
MAAAASLSRLAERNEQLKAAWLPRAAFFLPVLPVAPTQRPMKVQGGCHCGAVRFEAELPDPPVPALDCNCSICRMTGFLHIMVPHEQLDLMTGRDALSSYRFGMGAAEHLFCRLCGVKSFYQPRSHPDAWSINANCLDQPVELAVERFDGHNWEAAKANLDAPE